MTIPRRRKHIYCSQVSTAVVEIAQSFYRQIRIWWNREPELSENSSISTGIAAQEPLGLSNGFCNEWDALRFDWNADIPALKPLSKTTVFCNFVFKQTKNYPPVHECPQTVSAPGQSGKDTTVSRALTFYYFTELTKSSTIVMALHATYVLHVQLHKVTQYKVPGLMLGEINTDWQLLYPWKPLLHNNYLAYCSISIIKLKLTHNEGPVAYFTRLSPFWNLDIVYEFPLWHLRLCWPIQNFIRGR